MDEEFKERLTKQSTWLRGLYMLLFVVINEIARIVVFAVVIFQFLATLLTGKTNPQLLRLGQGLSTFIYQVLSFLTYNSDDKPYPFSSWPQADEPATEKKTGKNKAAPKLKAAEGAKEKPADKGDTPAS